MVSRRAITEGMKELSQPKVSQQGRGGTRYEYDPLGRLTAVVDALGQRTEYGYDEAGSLVRQVDANGHVTRYEYDGLGRGTATVLPLGQRSTTAYDAAGQPVLATAFDGATTAYTYDERGRLTAKAYGAGGAVDGGFMRGSGTSQATAVVSGAAALVLQQHPTWTNNQVKALLTLTASRLSAGLQTDAAQGRGRLNLTAALPVTSAAAGQAVTGSTGTATLESARGSAHSFRLPGPRPCGRDLLPASHPGPAPEPVTSRAR
jgi:YD repeat-containing protein